MQAELDTPKEASMTPGGFSAGIQAYHSTRSAQLASQGGKAQSSRNELAKTGPSDTHT